MILERDEDILKKIAEAGEDPREQFIRDHLKSVALKGGIDNLIAKGFLTAPASTKYHGSYAGGLFDHSVAVMNCLLDLTKRLDLKWTRPESPVIIGLLHDLCKIDQYKYDEETQKYVWNNAPIVKGHGIKSVIYAQQLCYLTLTREEIACIVYHMGAFTPAEEWNDYTAAIKEFPNVLWTHTADMWADKILGR